MLIRIRKAQSTLEYSLLIGVVAAGLLYMQNYLKRSYQGRLQAVGDQIGDPYSPGNIKRIEHTEVTNISDEKTIKGVDGVTETTVTEGSQKTSSTRELKNLDTETWRKD